MIHDKRAVTARVSSAVTVAIMVVLTVAFVVACSLISSDQYDRYDAWRYQTDTGRRAHD